MGARALTLKQKRFAELLAGGSTKVDAFRQAYPSDRRGKGTEHEGAKRVARHPSVAAEVQRLTLLRSPHDATAQAEHIAARLLELSKSSEPSVALRAIAQWARLAGAGLLKPAPPVSTSSTQPVDRTQLLNDLRGLYDKAFGRTTPNGTELLGPPSPEREEANDQVIDIESSDTSVNEPAALSSLSELTTSLPDQDMADNSDQPEVPESVEPEAYEWQYLPGFFGKARRVRVRR